MYNTLNIRRLISFVPCRQQSKWCQALYLLDVFCFFHHYGDVMANAVVSARKMWGTKNFSLAHSGIWSDSRDDVIYIEGH